MIIAFNERAVIHWVNHSTTLGMQYITGLLGIELQAH